MGRELTKRHSFLFEKKVRNPFLFAQDIYKYGKARELASFIVWELFHKLRLFPKQEYLKFSNSEALTLDNESLTGLEFGEKIDRQRIKASGRSHGGSSPCGSSSGPTIVIGVVSIPSVLIGSSPFIELYNFRGRLTLFQSPPY